MSVFGLQRPVLSSCSKGFSLSPEKMFRAIDAQLLVKLIFITDIPQEFMNLTKRNGQKKIQFQFKFTAASLMKSAFFFFFNLKLTHIEKIFLPCT